MTFVSVLVCSEPITEEGDGEAEHLPSEDGQYDPDNTSDNLTRDILHQAAELLNNGTGTL